jgi:hypothetical protein
MNTMSKLRVDDLPLAPMKAVVRGKQWIADVMMAEYDCEEHHIGLQDLLRSPRAFVAEEEEESLHWNSPAAAGGCLGLLTAGALCRTITCGALSQLPVPGGNDRQQVCLVPETGGCRSISPVAIYHLNCARYPRGSHTTQVLGFGSHDTAVRELAKIYY